MKEQGQQAGDLGEQQEKQGFAPDWSGAGCFHKTLVTLSAHLVKELMILHDLPPYAFFCTGN
jgi:hypothetical protein